MSSRPSFQYSSVSNRWELRGKGGKLLQVFPDGNAGNVLGKVTLNVVGSSAGVAAAGIGSIGVVVGTITNCTGLAVGDVVFGNPVSAMGVNAGGFAGFHIPTTNTLNVYSTGTLPAMGWDIIAFRPVGSISG